VAFNTGKQPVVKKKHGLRHITGLATQDQKTGIRAATRSVGGFGRHSIDFCSNGRAGSSRFCVSDLTPHDQISHSLGIIVFGLIGAVLGRFLELSS
jgi:hypothetical protein